MFEVEPNDRDVFLEELFMRADPDTVEISLHVYDTNLRNGMSPELAFRFTLADLGEVPGPFVTDDL